jgi:hypothetical protein
MPDPLHEDICHTIRLCWKSLCGQQVFKKITVDLDLAAMLPIEFSPRSQISNIMSCGHSANRLCEILVNNALSDYTGSSDAILVSDSVKLSTAIQAMKHSDSYVLVRINVLGGAAGHSYIFLTFQRHANDALKGYIYQTNVGCFKDSAFDLISWIDDPKSAIEVDLVKHLSELAKGFQLAPGFTYQEKFMLSDKALTQDELASFRTAKSTDPARFVIMWKPVVESTAMANLLAIRNLIH